MIRRPATRRVATPVRRASLVEGAFVRLDARRNAGSMVEVDCQGARWREDGVRVCSDIYTAHCSFDTPNFKLCRCGTPRVPDRGASSEQTRHQRHVPTSMTSRGSQALAALGKSCGLFRTQLRHRPNHRHILCNKSSTHEGLDTYINHQGLSKTFPRSMDPVSTPSTPLCNATLRRQGHHVQ